VSFALPETVGPEFTLHVKIAGRPGAGSSYRLSARPLRPSRKALARTLNL
jgi:hypothetical protein